MLFQGFTEIQNCGHGLNSVYVGAKTLILMSEIMQILQSHYPPYGNVQVILLKFGMATTSRLFKYL